MSKTHDIKENVFVHRGKISFFFFFGENQRKNKLIKKKLEEFSLFEYKKRRRKYMISFQSLNAKQQTTPTKIKK